MKGTPTVPAAATCVLGTLVALAFVANLVSYWFLGDDAFISFRYAKNLVDGLGLVFNAGEYVEGYTNFLWVMLMAGAMELGLSVELFANWVGAISGAGMLALVARVGARRSSWRDPLIWIAPAALAANRSFCAWSTGGLETQTFSLLVFAGLMRFLDERENATRWPLLSAVLLSTAALTRPEGLLFGALTGIFFAWEVVRGRRNLAPLILWTGTLGALVATHLLWRHGYYGLLVPNTFYAKVSGAWVEQGLLYLSLFVSDHSVAWLTPLLILLPWLRRDAWTGLCWAVLTSYVVYLLYIGGDRFEYRFIVPILPYFYLLLQEAVREIVRSLGLHLQVRAFALPAGALFGGLVVLSAWLPSVWGFTERAGIASIEGIGAYAQTRVDEGRFLKSLVDEGFLRGDEVIAVTGAGALPYYSELPTVDCHGLTDTEIARQPIAQRGVIGHEKMASEAYLAGRGVVFYDVMNRLVLPAGMAPTRAKTPYSGRIWHARARGRVLQFGTFLDEHSLRQRLARFEIAKRPLAIGERRGRHSR